MWLFVLGFAIAAHETRIKLVKLARIREVPANERGTFLLWVAYTVCLCVFGIASTIWVLPSPESQFAGTALFVVVRAAHPPCAPLRVLVTSRARPWPAARTEQRGVHAAERVRAVFAVERAPSERHALRRPGGCRRRVRRGGRGHGSHHLRPSGRVVARSELLAADIDGGARCRGAGGGATRGIGGCWLPGARHKRASRSNIPEVTAAVASARAKKHSWTRGREGERTRLLEILASFRSLHLRPGNETART